ncbi:MAG: aminotransferase class I/II-fold pyridoxal phosphate-dependent enzyme [Acidimicrobiales bacterium]
MTSWVDWAADQSVALHRAGRWRTVVDLDGPGPTTRLLDAVTGGHRDVVSFAGNDYLGLARHPAVVAAAHEAIDRCGTGAGAARLLAGARPVHRELEEALADWKGAEQAVLFPTGYAANLGVMAALGDSGVRIVSDERNHASVVDGCRLARAEVVVFPHGDLAAAERALAGAERALVVSESVFSMDGDVAAVDDLAALCSRTGALLVLDEAHGVLGPDLSAPPADLLLMRVGTLSKTLGSLGGYVAGSADLCDLIVNRARPFIFTTAPPPAAAAAALAAVAVCRSAEGDELRRRLRSNVKRIAPGHRSPIVAVVVGDEYAALAASAALLERGLFVPAIRPPTVAPDTSRLRISLSALHTPAHLEALVSALQELDVVTA